MVLILRKHDFKLVSCSRKKVLVYESLYTLPLSLSSSQLEQEIQQRATLDKEKITEKDHDDGKPQHVQSIKSVSAHTVPPPNTTGTTKFRAPTELDNSAATQTSNSGEGCCRP
jgi:hypothetical protein